jgi:protein TonB
MSAVSPLLESSHTRLGRWVGAALIAAGLHAGGLALALIHQHEDDAADDAAGALTVELAPLPAVTPVDSPDVAHGPEQQQAKLTPEASKRVVEKVQEDIPPVESSPAPEPEVVLPKPNPEEKEQPKEEKAEEAAPEERTPQQDADIPVTTAPPRVEAQPAPSIASKQGQSALDSRVRKTWQKGLSRHLERHKRYPETARRQRLTGSVTVRFILDREGQVTLVEVSESSGSPILDEEALATLKRASPMPVPPTEVTDAYLENFVRIDFNFK